MADYTKTTNFTAKDSLSTGDPLKIIKGSEHDTEFDNIATAIATKYDSDDLASQAEAEAGTSLTKLLTPGRLTNWAQDNGGFIEDIQALTDPGADTLLGWDDSGSAVIGFTLHASILHSGTQLSVDHDAATNFVADEHVAHSGVSITAGTGLSGGGTIAATRNLEIDWTELAEMTINALDDGDLFCVYDASAAAHVKVSYEHLGLPIVSTTSSQTPADADTNKAFVLTGATDRTFTLNTGVGELGNIFVLVQADTGSWDIAGTSTVTHSMAGVHTRTAGSVIVLLKIGADEWVAYGDGAAS